MTVATSFDDRMLPGAGWNWKCFDWICRNSQWGLGH